MKNLIVLALILIGGTAMAQSSSFGLKGGINYGATGDYDSPQEGMQDATNYKGKDKTGFHLGGFASFELMGIFIQPELMYTRLNTEYPTYDYRVDKIDAPLLVGVKVLGPLNIKAGPSFQYILKNELENTNIKISDVEDEITMGYQMGAGVDFGRLGVDLRYEGAFKENTAFSETASENFTIDSRPSQWIVSLSYKFQ
jgi:opacity protein-like surface antigen